MRIAAEYRENFVSALMDQCIENGCAADVADAFRDWQANRYDAEGSRKASDAIKAILPGAIAADAKNAEDLQLILDNADQLVKKSIWCFGGDGWAYDIGYGGLDHVLAMGDDINILVVDTEVYSNTGGQSSKSTPTGSVAKFAAAGKRTKKKDLGKIAMSYGYIYVASICMGSNPAQALKALQEAEAYHGPSLIIAYAPCINHGINMSRSMAEAKRAVEVGYWPLYRYNPDLEKAGKNPFTLDSKAPAEGYRDFIMGEVRYRSLYAAHPELAEELFTRSESEAKQKIASYMEMAKND